MYTFEKNNITSFASKLNSNNYSNNFFFNTPYAGRIAYFSAHSRSMKHFPGPLFALHNSKV